MATTGIIQPSYDEAEPFLIFIDKYVKLAVGGHFIAKWMKMNRNKTLLDNKLTSSDIAYTILICENSKEVWDEEIHITKPRNYRSIRCKGYLSFMSV